MIQEISKSDRHKERIKDRDGISSIKPEHDNIILEVNKELEEFRREYRIKNRKSQISAANIILTA